MNSCERLREVGSQVVDGFDSHRQPHQRIADAEARALLGRNRRVRHDRRVLDETLDAAQAFGEREDGARLEETARAGEVGVELDRHHAAEAAHLLARERVLRVRGEPRVAHAAHARLPLEPGGELHRVLAMALHAHVERLHPAQREETVERPRDRADRVLQETEALGVLRVAIVAGDDRNSADDVRVPVQVLRRRVHDDVEAELDGTLHPGCGECVVGDADQLVSSGDRRKCVEVDQPQQRIGRRLDEHHSRLGAGSPTREPPDRTDRRS